MRNSGIILAICAIMLATVLGSGCIANNSAQPPCATCTYPTPVPIAVDLHNKGFDAYINGDYTLALDYYDKSLVADPNYTRTWIDKGNLLIRINRTSDGISAYDSALAIESNIPEIWNSRGEALMTLGKYIEARDSFDKALQFAPDSATAKANRDLADAKLK